jgi:hypothetical protein
VSDNEAIGDGVSEEAETDPLVKYESIIGPLREKFDGDIKVFPIPKRFGEIAVIAPPTNSKSYQVYTNNLHNEQADKFVESRKFALACVVYPADIEKVKAILDARPGFVQTFANAGAALCGAGAAELGKG